MGWNSIDGIRYELVETLQRVYVVITIHAVMIFTELAFDAIPKRSPVIIQGLITQGDWIHLNSSGRANGTLGCMSILQGGSRQR